MKSNVVYPTKCKEHEMKLILSENVTHEADSRGISLQDDTTIHTYVAKNERERKQEEKVK